MAHLEALVPEVSSYPYSNGKKTGSRVKFPDTVAFAGMNKPSRFEGDIVDLEVTGEIPSDIDGTFYRVQPDHRFPPMFEDDIHFNGDGVITAISIKNGHADFKQRYVKTDKYKKEDEAKQALFGRYRNPYTDNESVRGVIRTVSNTNITFWRGMLLASKEDGPPFAMDPVTLETIGRYDFEGQITAPTFTAHPKFDPETGEMICFAYEAGADGHDCGVDVVSWTIDKDGRKTEELWFKAPFAGMIHDCGISKNYLVLPLTPLKMSLERLKAGGNKFAWDPKEDQVYGIVPRRGGKPEDVKWFRADNGFHGHVAGCYENEDGHIIFDLTVADGNVFFWFPPDGERPDLASRGRLSSPTCRWVFDPKAKDGTRYKPSIEWTTNGEFSRIDDRWVTKKYEHFWQLRVDPTRPYDFQRCGPPAGGLFNCMAHYTWDPADEGKIGTEDVWFAGPTATYQEPVFIPKEGGKEGEGYLAALKNNLDELRNDVVIWDALNLAKGPLATLHLPLRMKLGLHGNFVDHRDIEAWQERRAGELGPVQPAKEPLPWQKAFANGGASQQNGQTNGHGVNGSS
ncbi:carotenoid oxygenase [Hypomontagnella submonticulosa]|nr:carotenoid oxygenase [Hypomontagnella submonticulosa]